MHISYVYIPERAAHSPSCIKPTTNATVAETENYNMEVGTKEEKREVEERRGAVLKIIPSILSKVAALQRITEKSVLRPNYILRRNRLDMKSTSLSLSLSLTHTQTHTHNRRQTERK